MGDLELKVHCFEDLEVGMQATYEKVLDEKAIAGFAELSGDVNPVHLDADYAARTPFKKCIAHGILTSSLISAIIGVRLPGPGTIYMSQELKFRAPAYVGDTVVASVTVAELFPEKGRARLACACTIDGKTILSGDAMVMVPKRDKMIPLTA